MNLKCILVVCFVSLVAGIIFFLSSSSAPESSGRDDEKVVQPLAHNVKQTAQATSPLVTAAEATTRMSNTVRSSSDPLNETEMDEQEARLPTIEANSDNQQAHHEQQQQQRSRRPALLPPLGFIRQLQNQLKSWSITCLDGKSKKNALKWSDSSASPCRGFVNFLDSSKTGLINRVFTYVTIEAHGDSTLRELMARFVERLGMRASLEKKDANMTMRDPKFFYRLVPAHVATSNGFTTTIRRPLRLSFRFDFFGEQILENFVSVPTLRLISVRRQERVIVPTPFFDLSPPVDLLLAGQQQQQQQQHQGKTQRNYVLLSLGSHIAKHVVMELKQGNNNNNWDHRCGTMRRRVIEPIQDFFVRRVLGFTVRRVDEALCHTLFRQEKSPQIIVQRDNADDDSSHVRSRSGGSIFNSTVPPADLVIFIMQSLECSAMQGSERRGFQLMAPFCGKMESYLTLLHELIISEISDVLLASTPEQMRSKAKCGGGDKSLSLAAAAAASVFCLLSDGELMAIQGRFLYVGPASCKDPSFKNALSSKVTQCTKDGIHMRARFVRVKMDLLLNVVSMVQNA